MSLPEEHVDTVCCPGDGSLTCAFLTMGTDGFQCGKGTFAEEVIRKRLANDTMGSKGDYCSGPPDFIPTSDIQ